MPKRSVSKPIPAFASEVEEREFWETHDTSPYFDSKQARSAVFPNLRPSTETISLRLPTALLSELKALANKRDVPYQSLLKVFLADRVANEVSRIDADTGRRRRSVQSSDSRRHRTRSGRLPPTAVR